MGHIELGCYRKNILNNFHTKSALLENNNEPIKREEKIKHTDMLSALLNLSLCVVWESYNCQVNENVNTIKHIIEHWTQITDH